MSSAATIVRLVGILGETFDRKITAETIDAYRLGLEDVSDQALMNTLPKLLRTCKFMPKPVEIREAAGVGSGEIATKDRPTLAWTDVRRAINRIGGYDSPDFEDKTINATIRAMGGWVTLCDSTSEDLVWREKDFLRTYSALMPLNLPDEQIERLAGITEKTNGSALPAPIVDVGCLTAGGSGVVRRIEQAETLRVTHQVPAAEVLAKRLTFDDRDVEEKTPVVVRDRSEQIEILKAMTASKPATAQRS